ncbi:MAG: hypothetical protein JJU19_00940 [Pararhodobacter sp.]|nr:hypothetical protein [Pararhodobacter sp.]
MRRFILFLAVVALVGWAVLSGPLAEPLQTLLAPVLQPFGRWLLSIQSAFQADLARELRGVSRGQATAFWALLGLCLFYGFAHALGPGHGKALLGAYGVSRRVGAARLAGIGLLAALAQASVGVALVLAVAGLAGMGRGTLQGIDRDVLAPAGLAAVAGLGLWLCWRALARLAPTWRRPSVVDVAEGRLPSASVAPGAPGPAAMMLAATRTGRQPVRAHVYRADCLPDCPDCGIAHQPPVGAMLQAATPREIAALVAAVAVRPCSGALLLLLLTWQMGLIWVGIAGAYAMALGTAGVSVALALALVAGRDGLLRLGGGWLAGHRRLWVAAGLEAMVGLLLMIGALSVFLVSA